MILLLVVLFVNTNTQRDTSYVSCDLAATMGRVLVHPGPPHSARGVSGSLTPPPAYMRVPRGASTKVSVLSSIYPSRNTCVQQNYTKRGEHVHSTTIGRGNTRTSAGGTRGGLLPVLMHFRVHPRVLLLSMQRKCLFLSHLAGST